jgi:hypothetical protein
MFELIDTQEGRRVVGTYSTHRKAFNASNRLEPVPTVRSAWRYQIRPKREG